jgi:methylmalonyl-CoA/ethylmalonyl-CoA epimerase
MLKGLHHVGIAVRSADEALGFYRDALGLEVAEDRVLEQEGVRGVLLRVGGGEIELLEPLGTEGSVARFLNARGPGLHHICFETDDCARDLRAVSERGAVLIDRVPRQGLAGMIGFLHPKSNHGVLVELATPPFGRHPSNDPGESALGIAEIAVVVKDRDIAVATFSRHFEVREVEAAAERGLPVGARASCLGIGETRIALLEPAAKGGLAAGYAEAHGEGLLLLSLRIPGLSAVVHRLNALGFESRLSPGNVQAFVAPDVTGGVSLQLIEGLSSSHRIGEDQW